MPRTAAPAGAEDRVPLERHAIARALHDGYVQVMAGENLH